MTVLKPHIDIPAVAKAMESILPEWQKVGLKDDDTAASKRDELLYRNQNLMKAFYKSVYTQTAIDWDYAITLFEAVYEEGKFKSPKDFANELNTAVLNTAKQREMVVLIPLGFQQSYGLFRKSIALKRSITIGDYKLSPATPSPKAFNRLLSNCGAQKIDDSQYEHFVRTSHNSLKQNPLLTFEAHGSIDAVRHQPSPNVRRLIALIELFGRVFEADEIIGFPHKFAANHVFIAAKHSNGLVRAPSHTSLALNLALGPNLVKSIKRADFGDFVKLLEYKGTKNKLVNRLVNALTFFGKAINERDNVTRFLFFVIAMEAIFSRDKNAPIKITLADLSSILCFKKAHRQAVHKDLRKIYDLRSGIVHGGDSSVKQEFIQKAEALAARAIYCSLALAASDKNASGPNEDRFFDQLTEMKIGVSSNSIKLPPWKGFESAEALDDLDL